MPKPKAFSRLLRHTLAERGLSEDAGAKIIGCQQGTLNRWMHGWTNPGVRHLRGIAKLTGMSVEQLVDLYEKAAKA